MKKFLAMFSIALVAMLSMSSCHGVRPGADEEAVLIDKPWFFGHGGVDMTPVESSSLRFRRVSLRFCCRTMVRIGSIPTSTTITVI